MKIQSQTEYIRDHIVSESIERESKEYSNILNYSIDELTKINMRKIAEEDDYGRHDTEILSEAISLSKATLNQESKKHNLDIDFSGYFKETEKSLEPVAKEISRLRGKLFTSRKEKRIGGKEMVSMIETDHRTTFDIVEIGLKESIDGLFSIPPIESFEFDIERTRKYFNMAGEWFPFEITIDDFKFILDDDGTIFVSVENYPDNLIEKARVSLQDLANKIYSNI